MRLLLPPHRRRLPEGEGQLLHDRPPPAPAGGGFANYSYDTFITDRDGDTLTLEADHLRHAEIENAIRDLKYGVGKYGLGKYGVGKYGVGLNHLPSGRFPANAAWLAVQVIALNLAR